MILAGHSDASYHSEPKAWSRVGRHLFLSTNTTIHDTAQIIKQMVLAAEATKLGVLFIKTKQATLMQLMLEAIGRPQLSNPSKLTMSLHMASSLTKSSLRPQKQLI